MADRLDEAVNEHGISVSVFRCETCGEVFTVCPQVPLDKADEWRYCMAETCASYEPTRDADLYFALDMVERGDSL